MKALSIAMILAVVSTPALARNADHHKHVRHHHSHRHVVVARDAAPGQGAYAGLVARHAAANGVPASLVHRVIMRESRYNPRAVSKGNYGMMQIRLGTARSMGYTGSAAGLLDPEVNMTYAVKYLAGAYKAAGGSESGAVANYARGYSAQGRSQLASRRGVTPYETPGSATFAMQTPTQGYYQQASYQRPMRRGTIVMQTLTRGARAGHGSAPATVQMAVDRHAVF